MRLNRNMLYPRSVASGDARGPRRINPTVFGLHPGFRPAHAKGIMLSGAFTPSPEAVSLTRAPHLTRDSTPITLRFSNSTGLPSIPDNAPDSNPRGLAIRFHLADRFTPTS
jgi:catalase